MRSILVLAAALSFALLGPVTASASEFGGDGNVLVMVKLADPAPLDFAPSYVDFSDRAAIATPANRFSAPQRSATPNGKPAPLHAGRVAGKHFSAAGGGAAARG